MEKEIKPRGVKKGETPQWKVGRKATGLKRNKNISFKVTEEEKEKIYDILDKIGGTRTEALLLILRKYSENLKEKKNDLEYWFSLIWMDTNIKLYYCFFFYKYGLNTIWIYIIVKLVTYV